MAAPHITDEELNHLISGSTLESYMTPHQLATQHVPDTAHDDELDAAYRVRRNLIRKLTGDAKDAPVEFVGADFPQRIAEIIAEVLQHRGAELVKDINALHDDALYSCNLSNFEDAHWMAQHMWMMSHDLYELQKVVDLYF